MEIDEKTNYFDKVSEFISRNPIENLWIYWDKSRTKITGYELYQSNDGSYVRKRLPEYM